MEALHGARALIGDWARQSVGSRQPDRRRHVQREDAEEAYARHPQQRPQVMKHLSVTVDLIGRCEKKLQVAEQVNNDKPKQHQPGDRHDHLAADRRPPELEQPRHLSEKDPHLAL